MPTSTPTSLQREIDHTRALQIDPHGLARSRTMTEAAAKAFGQIIDEFADWSTLVVEQAQQAALTAKQNRDLSSGGRHNALRLIGQQVAQEIDKAANAAAQRVRAQAASARSRMKLPMPDAVPDVQHARWREIRDLLRSRNERGNIEDSIVILTEDLEAAGPSNWIERMALQAGARGELETLQAIQAAPALWKRELCRDVIFAAATQAYLRSTDPDAVDLVEGSDEAERGIETTANVAVGLVAKACNFEGLVRPSKDTLKGVA